MYIFLCNVSLAVLKFKIFKGIQRLILCCLANKEGLVQEVGREILSTVLLYRDIISTKAIHIYSSVQYVLK